MTTAKLLREMEVVATKASTGPGEGWQQSTNIDDFFSKRKKLISAHFSVAKLKKLAWEPHQLSLSVTRLGKATVTRAPRSL